MIITSRGESMSETNHASAGELSEARHQPSTQGQSEETHRFVYHGRIGTLYRIWLLNIFLTIVTFGVYSFWGRTRMRKYAASAFELGGDRLEYTGTGGELFRGFLIAFPIIILLYLPLVIYPMETHPIVSLTFIPILYFIYVGVYAALRYRLSRTVWRGIRGRLTGSPFEYGALVLGLSVVNILTLGVMIPWSDRMAIRYQMRNVWFGNTQGEFNDTPRELWRMHWITWLLFIPTLSLSRLWYRAALLRYQYGNFSIGRVKLNAVLSGTHVFDLVVFNALILLFTLGLGRPITVYRELKFISDRIFLTGDLDAEAAAVLQSTEDLSSTGEGLDGLLSNDSGFF